MDDDVILDGRIIHNAMLFLGYAQHDFVLGGSMLYVSKPTTLHEAGSAFDPLWFIDRLGDGTDLAEPSGLDFFNTWHRADYIGWWFCATPIRQIEAAGLSPPIFLHHDDIEYGCRLAKCGVPTVAPPGLAVWHEHSFSKDGEWEQYYDIRNRLILSVMHGDKTPQPRTPIVLGYVVDLVLTHRYRAAMMCIAGVSDFLLGPDRLFSVSPAERHRQVRAIAEVFQPDEMAATEALAHEWGEVVDRPKSLGANLLPYLLRLLAVLFLPYRTKRPRIFDHENVNPIAVGNAAYIMTNGCTSVFVRQVPNRLRAISILWRGLTVAVRFRIRRDAVNADWSARLGAYQTTEMWRTLFGVRD